MKPPFLIVDKLTKHFGGVTALDRVSFSLGTGEILGLLGANGSGKTTLLNLITGLMAADGGTVLFRGLNLLRLRPHQIAVVGVFRTFQQLRLAYQLSVLDNVLLAFKHQSGEQLSNIFFRHRLSVDREAKNRARAMELLVQGGLAQQRHQRTEELSYGQQKLLSLICGLAAEADLLLLDEPFSGVADPIGSVMVEMIQALSQQHKSIVIVEHNLDIVTELCDRVLLINAGKVISDGRPDEICPDFRRVEAYF